MLVTCLVHLTLVAIVYAYTHILYVEACAAIQFYNSTIKHQSQFFTLLEVLHGGADILGQLAVLIALASLSLLHHFHNILVHQPITQLCKTGTNHSVREATHQQYNKCASGFQHSYNSTNVWCKHLFTTWAE